MRRKILPSITTTEGSDWREKIREINELGLQEVAIFPTCLQEEQRRELYRLLKNSKVKNIPYCHLRNDMKAGELEYLVKNYNTRVFSVHMRVEYPTFHDWLKRKKIIYIENVYHPFDEKELMEFGGICLDFSHLENDRILARENFKRNIKVIEKNFIGVNHISSIKKVSQIDNMGYTCYAYHVFDNLSEFDYLKKYPLSYFSPLIIIEVENSIKEQLMAKDYIANLLKEKK